MRQHPRTSDGHHPDRRAMFEQARFERARYHHDPHGFDGHPEGRGGSGHRDPREDPRVSRDGAFGPGFPDFGDGFGPAFGPVFGRGVRRGRGRAARGDVRSAILSLLAEGPSNGYSLIKRIGEKTHGAWTPSPGSVYPTLQQLVDEELIEATGDGRRTEYRLSDDGRAYVEENAEALEAAWKATAGRNASLAAFQESVAKLVGVIHQVRMAGSEEQQKAAIDKLDEVRRALYLILAE